MARRDKHIELLESQLLQLRKLSPDDLLKDKLKKAATHLKQLNEENTNLRAQLSNTSTIDNFPSESNAVAIESEIQSNIQLIKELQDTIQRQSHQIEKDKLALESHTNSLHITSDMEEKYTRLEDLNFDLGSKLLDLEDEKIRLESLASKFESQSKVYADELLQLKSQESNNINPPSDDIMVDMEERNIEIETLKSELKTSALLLDDQKTEFESYLKIRDENEVNLNEKISSQEVQIYETLLETTQMINEIQKLQLATKKHQAAMSEKESIIIDLRKALIEAEKKTDDLNKLNTVLAEKDALLNTFELEIQASQEDSQILQDKIASLSLSLKSKSKESEENQKVIDKLTTKVEELRIELKRNQEIKKANESVMISSDLNSENDSIIKDLRSEVTNLNASLEVSNNQRNSLSLTIETLEGSLLSLTDTINSLGDQNSIMESNNVKLEAEIQVLKHELLQQESEVVELQKMNQGILASNDSNALALNDSIEKDSIINDLRKEIETLRSALEEFNDKQKSLLTSIETLKDQNSSLTSKIEDSGHTLLIETLTSERDKLVSDQGLLLTKLTQMKQSFTARTQNESVELTSLNLKLTTLLEENETLRQSLIESQHTLQESHSNQPTEEFQQLQETHSKTQREMQRLRHHLIEAEELSTQESVKQNELLQEFKTQIELLTKEREVYNGQLEEEMEESVSLREEVRETGEKFKGTVEENERLRGLVESNGHALMNLQGVLETFQSSILMNSFLYY